MEEIRHQRNDLMIIANAVVKILTPIRWIVPKTTMKVGTRKRSLQNTDIMKTAIADMKGTHL